MNADLHIVDWKRDGKGNLFVIFGAADVTATIWRWLVKKKGKRIANYNQTMQSSGCQSLEEVNELDKEELLSRLARLARNFQKKMIHICPTPSILGHSWRMR